MSDIKFVSACFSPAPDDENDLDCSYFDNMLVENCEMVKTVKNTKQLVFDSYFDKCLVDICEQIELTRAMSKVSSQG
ncbi:unnamed protein product [Parnassius apollo]|uniref:(apollo) hypothetical protein n=1 Tax=Parnassius apollo TaxID=110799 RepID=A0A8S3WJI0_PARAO|nr:unnamed protein product [Parnassius apollo]